MSWMNDFRQEDFAPFAYLTARRDLAYYEISKKEAHLDSLKDKNKKEEWKSALFEIENLQREQIQALRKHLPLASNHLNYILDIHMDVDQQRLKSYQSFLASPDTHWRAWEKHSMQRTAEEMRLERDQLGRLADLMDYDDARLKPGILIYRLFDFLVFVAEKLGEYDGLLTQKERLALKALLQHYMDSVRTQDRAEAQQKVEELINVDLSCIKEWAVAFVDKSNADFSNVIYGPATKAATKDRGIQQLYQLSVAVQENLAATYRHIKWIADNFRGPDSALNDTADYEERLHSAIEGITAGFDNYNLTQLDYNMFLATIVPPIEKRI